MALLGTSRRRRREPGARLSQRLLFPFLYSIFRVNKALLIPVCPLHSSSAAAPLPSPPPSLSSFASCFLSRCFKASVKDGILTTSERLTAGHVEFPGRLFAALDLQRTFSRGDFCGSEISFSFEHWSLPQLASSSNGLASPGSS